MENQNQGLSKELKIKCVERAIIDIETGASDYCCVALANAHKRYDDICLDEYYELFDYFPDFLEFKPAGIGKNNSWFGNYWQNSNRKKRVSVLKEYLSKLESNGKSEN